MSLFPIPVRTQEPLTVDQIQRSRWDEQVYLKYQVGGTSNFVNNTGRDIRITGICIDVVTSVVVVDRYPLLWVAKNNIGAGHPQMMYIFGSQPISNGSGSWAWAPGAEHLVWVVVGRYEINALPTINLRPKEYIGVDIPAMDAADQSWTKILYEYMGD
jgi:hypothetical protein